MERNTTTYGARWIIPISRAPLENAAIVVANGTIQKIVPGGRASAVSDLGEVAMLPRLINAHTHLEFSSIARPIGVPGIPITDWIPQVISERQKTLASFSQSGTRHTVNQSILRGITECVETGTVAIGEIATSPWFNETSWDERCQVVGFIERLGHDPTQISERVSEAERWLDDAHNASTPKILFTPGLSPHAPYSMHDDLFEQLIELSIKRNLPVAIHLAESEQELRWLKSGDGPFAEMLESLGIAFQRPENKRPLDYLRPLSKTTSSLIVHGNYLVDDELDFISSHTGRMHLVYCPRTHEFFGHKPWPMNAALKRGINIAIGTDSRASNPDLDLWQELKTALRRHPDVSPARILHMGTLGGARALGLDRQLGSLDPGKRAVWKSVEVPNCNQNNVERLVLENG